MSATMTRLRVPGQRSFTGIQDYGVKSTAEMIKLVRAYADGLRDQLAVIDAADDEAFQIDVVKGPFVQHFVKALQWSSLTPLPSPPNTGDAA